MSPKALNYDGLGTDNVVVPVSSPGANINRIEIEWRPTTTPPNTPADCPATIVNVFSSQPDWDCGYGVLRADIVPSEGALTRAGLSDGLMSGYFVPTNTGSASGQVSYVAHSGGANAARPALAAADCDNGATYGTCTVSITNLNGEDSFILRLSSLYRTSDVTVRAYLNAGGPLELFGAQAIIDSTGKSKDVLRRIQVHLPLTASSTPLPGVALQSSGSVCKRFSSSPGYYENADDIYEPDASNAMCN
jgi:hypothetical protein